MHIVTLYEETVTRELRELSFHQRLFKVIFKSSEVCATLEYTAVFKIQRRKQRIKPAKKNGADAKLI